MNDLNPKKLLLSKWTAVQPVGLEKHFLVTSVVGPVPPDSKVEWVEIQAVHSGAVRRIAWRQLRDEAQWRQGWL